MQTEPLSSKTSATNDESAPQLASSDLELRPSDFNLPPTLEASLNTQKLVAPERSEGGNHQLSTINHQLTATVIDTKPLPATVQPHKVRVSLAKSIGGFEAAENSRAFMPVQAPPPVT